MHKKNTLVRKLAKNIDKTVNLWQNSCLWRFDTAHSCSLYHSIGNDLGIGFRYDLCIGDIVQLLTGTHKICGDNRHTEKLCLTDGYAESLIERRLHIHIAILHIWIWISTGPVEYHHIINTLVDSQLPIFIESLTCTDEMPYEPESTRFKHRGGVDCSYLALNRRNTPHRNNFTKIVPR